MPNTDAMPLDAEELMHLALHEAGQNQTEKAISHLKQVLEVSPEHGKAYYLLGALHAEIGLFDRAIEEMQAAVKYDPGIPTAHFQLGLLLITSGNLAEAETAWQALDELGPDEPLFVFKRGLLQLAQNEYSACIEDLTRGIELNTVNPKLNFDMQRIIDSTRPLLDAEGADGQPEGDESVGKQALLSAYQRSQFDSDE